MPSLSNPFFCKKHGQLDATQVQRCDYAHRNTYYKCKICIREFKKAKGHYKDRGQHRPPKGSSKYIEMLEKRATNKRKWREELTDAMVREMLVHHKKLPKEVITQEMIEFYRAVKKIGRVIKSSRQPASDPS
jgi:hypothetical protein